MVYPVKELFDVEVYYVSVSLGEVLLEPSSPPDAPSVRV
jgi:hypothetical protein